MDTPTKFHSVGEFFSAFETTSNLIELEGFLEKENEETVRIALFGDCKNWTLFPAAAISDIEVVRIHVPCITEKEGYHTHPYVKMLTDPANPDAARALSRFALAVAHRPRAMPSRPHKAEEFPIGLPASYKVGARRIDSPSNLFDLLVQQRAFRSFRPSQNMHPSDYVCEYHEELCAPNHCVCVNYQTQHAVCCDCCIA